MSVRYNIVARGNPSDPEAPKKYFPSVVSTDRKNLRDMSEIMAEVSTVSSADTMASLEAMLIVLPRLLADGNIVELGDFGSFWLRTKADGAEYESDVSADSITSVLPHFRPGKAFKEKLEQVEFKKA